MYILTEVSFGAMIAACAWRRSLMLLEQLERQNWRSNRISPSVWQLGFTTPIKVLSADLLVPYFKYGFVFLSFLRSLFRPSCVEVVAYLSLAVVPLFSLFPCVCTFLGFPYWLLSGHNAAVEACRASFWADLPEDTVYITLASHQYSAETFQFFDLFLSCHQVEVICELKVQTSKSGFFRFHLEGNSGIAAACHVLISQPSHPGRNWKSSGAIPSGNAWIYVFI